MLFRSPILSFTTEEIYKLLFDNNKSIHLEKFKVYPEAFNNKTLNDRWIELIKIRNICNISIEEKRSLKEIGSSLDFIQSIGSFCCPECS